MKTVFSTKDEVAHLFAHQTQSEARDPKNRIFFRDNTIFSYGQHFPIATHHKKGNKQILLFTYRTYGVTTTAHTNAVASACSHLEKLYCYDPLAAHRGIHDENLKSFDLKARTYIEKIQKATKPENYIPSLEYIKNQYQAYVTFFKIPKSKTVDLIYVTAPTPNKQAAKELIEAAKEKLKKAQIKKNALLVKNFRTHKTKTYYNIHNPNETLLRLSQDAQSIETSKGIQIPIKVAQRVLQTLQKIKNGQEKAENHKILDYTITACNQKEVIIGCHCVTWEEIEKIKFPKSA